MLSLQPRYKIIARNVSFQSVFSQQKSAETSKSEDRIGHFIKSGRKILEVLERTKPDGWDQAKPFKAVPGPKPLPIIGNLWRFLPGGEYHNVSLIEMHRRLKDRYGDVVNLTAMPGKPDYLFVYNPIDMETVLRNDGPWPIRHSLPSLAYYREHTRPDLYGGVGGVATEQGEKWYRFRSLVNKSLMNTHTVELYVDSLDKVANDLIDNIRRLAKSDPKMEMPEDFQNELYKWTLEAMGVITYNKRIGCLKSHDSEGQQLINSALTLFDLMYKLDFQPSLWTFYSTRNWRKFVRLLDFFNNIGQKYIDECLANSHPSPDLPDHQRSVLEQLAEVDKNIAFAMATDMLISGVDTTGKTMAAALYYLSKNPDKQALLRKELEEIMPSKDTPLTKEMLREPRYLRAVIKETTRLAPIAIGNQRLSVADLVLGGYQVPKGTSVVTVNIIPCHDEKHFFRAKEFIPERWLRTTEGELSYKNAHRFAFLPFGFGPRSCIGQRLAYLELEIGLSKIIRNFQLSWNYPEPRFGSRLLYGIVDPLKIKVEELRE